MDDPITSIRAELSRRIRSIEWRGGTRSIATEVDAIRALAHRNGMLPAVSVAHALEAALARGEHGPLIHAWLDMLADAVGSERQDAAACDTFAAACAVRFA